MMTLSNAASILSAPPGSLAYHLILTVSLALLYAVSQAHLRQTALPRAGRWTLASGWLVSLRLFFLAAALLNWMQLVGNAEVLPALGQFIDLAGLLVFAWAFLVPQSDLRSDRVLMVTVVLNVVALGLGLVGQQLGLASYGLTQSLLFTIWQAITLAALLAVIVLLIIDRPPQWRFALLGFVLMSAGYSGQLWLAPQVDPLASYVRLSNLVVYPLLVIAGARALVITRSQEQKPEIDLSQLAYTKTTEADIAIALAGMASASTQTELAERAAKAIAETMRAEYCLLISTPDPEGNFSIDTGYDLIREQQLAGASLDEDRSPVLAAALEQGKTLNLSSRSRSPDVYTLQSLLGLQSTGPGLLVPVIDGSEVYGGLLLLSPYVRRSWSEDQQAMLEHIADHLALRFSQLRQPSAAPSSQEAYDALLEAQQRIHNLERDNMRLFETLHSEGQLDLDELEADYSPSQAAHDAEDTIAILEAEIERLNLVAESSQIDEPEGEHRQQLSEELQSAYQELMEARSRIEELEAEIARADGRPSATKRDLEAIAAIAQELRQPMSSVLGYTDLLLGESVGLLGAMQRKFLERVRAAVERMGGLIQDLIQMTALESGSLDLQPTQVDLLNCVEEAVNEVSPALQEKRISLQMDFPDEVPAVYGDEMAISHIMAHLLRNAITASPEGESIVLSSRVENAPEQGFLMVSVQDAGEGIPPEDLGRVFQRLDTSAQTMIPGLGEEGVGLNLVKGLSEALGGRVWVESEMGHGSTFTVLLPLAEGNLTESPNPSGPLQD